MIVESRYESILVIVVYKKLKELDNIVIKILKISDNK